VIILEWDLLCGLGIANNINNIFVMGSFSLQVFIFHRNKGFTTITTRFMQSLLHIWLSQFNQCFACGYKTCNEGLNLLVMRDVEHNCKNC